MAIAKLLNYITETQSLNNNYCFKQNIIIIEVKREKEIKAWLYI
jgi:hypothetical protein